MRGSPNGKTSLIETLIEREHGTSVFACVYLLVNTRRKGGGVAPTIFQSNAHAQGNTISAHHSTAAALVLAASVCVCVCIISVKNLINASAAA